MEEKELSKVLIKMARSIQRSLRLSTAASSIFPLVAISGRIAGVMSWTTLFASMISLVFVYFLHRNNYGPMKNWWWLRRGHFMVIPTYLDRDKVRIWCQESGHEFVEVTTGVLKFFRTSDAVHFKLVWC